MRDEPRAPLFRFDPGWPFVIAGLLLLVAGVLIPGHRELLGLRGELLRQETREQVAFEQLRAYDEFLAGVRESDPEVIRRLAMAHLNKIPAGEESLLLTPGMNQTVGEWIESSIPDRTVVVPPYPDTVLARWALGPGRLWMLGVAVMLLFVGFVLGPSTPAAPSLSALATWRRVPRAAMAATAEVPVEDGVDGSVAGLEAADPEAPVIEDEVPLEVETIADPEENGPADESTGAIEDEVEPVDAIADPSEESLDMDVGSAAEDLPSGPAFDLVETKSLSPVAIDDAETAELRADELELWQASETRGEWSAPEWLDRLPPEDSVASCDDVTLAFLDRSDGAIEATPVRGAD